MLNENTQEYLDKIKTRLFENLRMLPHAPGVQMADIPADGVTIKEDSAALDEADPDKSNPQQVKDKSVEPDNEFEEPGSGNKDNSNANNDKDSGDKSGNNGKSDEAMEVDEAKEEKAE